VSDEFSLGEKLRIVNEVFADICNDHATKQSTVDKSRVKSPENQILLSRQALETCYRGCGLLA